MGTQSHHEYFRDSNTKQGLLVIFMNFSKPVLSILFENSFLRILP